MIAQYFDCHIEHTFYEMCIWNSTNCPSRHHYILTENGGGIVEEKNIINEILEHVPEDIKEKTLNNAISLMKVMFKDPLIEIGNIFSDKIKAKRYYNMIHIISEANQKLQEKGISPNEPSLKVIMQLLEKGSLEDDLDLRSKWSSLLKNSLDETKKNDTHIAYVSILNELTPSEAMVLDYLYNEFNGDSFDVFHAGYLAEREYEINFDIFKIYLDNFHRLNLVDNTLDRDIHKFLKESKLEVFEFQEEYIKMNEINNSRSIDFDGTVFSFSYLCKGFMEACTS